jgi:Secretion system C-terminal sorting domain
MKTIITLTIMIATTLLGFGQGIINNNGNIVSNGDINIVINENASWTDNGTFTSSTSDVIFIGNSNQSVQGSSNTSFNKLTLNKSLGDVLIGTNISVTNNITLTSGDIDLQNSTIDLSSTGVIQSETDANRVKVGNTSANTGTIQYTRTINNIVDFDPANLGVLITTDQNLGSITVVRGHQTQQGTGSYTSNYSVARYYLIPGITEIDGANVNVEMTYWESEQGAMHPSESNLVQYQSVTQASSDHWTPLTSTVNTSSNLLTPGANPYSTYVYSNIATTTFLGKFTLGSTDSPLPIELLSFDAVKHDASSVFVDWQTASEIGNDYFTVQRSKNIENWENLAIVPASGNTNTLSYYNTFDYEPYPGISYYRLKQTDYNGIYSYSDIKEVNFGEADQISIHPNPTQGFVNIVGSDIISVEVLDMNGRLIRKSANSSIIDLSEEANGVYHIRILTNQESILKKVVKY